MALTGMKGQWSRHRYVATARATSGESILDLDLMIKGSRLWDEMSLEDTAYYRWVAPILAREIKARTMAGRLPDGSPVAELQSRRWKKWKAQAGKSPTRDATMSGDMWSGLTFKPFVRGDDESGVRLFFSGAHAPSGERSFVPKSGKYAGQERPKYVARQLVANNWALITRAGHKIKGQPNGRPGHVFMDTDAQQIHFVTKSFEAKVLQAHWGALPLDPEVNTGTGWGA